MPSNPIFPFVLFTLALYGFTYAQAQQVTIPAGVPLRVQIDKRYPIATGTKGKAI